MARRNCYHPVLADLNLGLMSLQQPALITLTLLEVLDAGVDVLLVDQLLVGVNEVLLNHLRPCLVAQVSSAGVSDVPVLIGILRNLEVLDQPESISGQVGGIGSGHILGAKVVSEARVYLPWMLSKVRCNELNGVRLGVRSRLVELTDVVSLRIGVQLLHVVQLTLHQLSVVLLLVGLRV